MGLLLIMFVLVLGYRYASSVPYQKNILKRSVGWESYVYLAQHGIISILLGILIFSFCTLVVLLIILTLEVTILSYLDITVNLSKRFRENLLLLVEGEKDILHYVVMTIATACISWVICEARIQIDFSKDKYDLLKSLDGILNVVIQSLQSNSSVKVSMKSRKVYVGMVLGEQFENTDLGNILIIPFFSGYRDKDTLDMKLNCEYMPVYEKNKFIDWDGSEFKIDWKKMQDFKLVIRIDEIETISLFDAEYSEDFLLTDKK
ncbi:hypothetical protein [Psychrobacter sp. UBA3068]|jgi:hypothetical protein|uniref:hypothetical protein n=1 Tax=Psychrobacter sp. UBA3068 TaxID=1947349 RepID=UPI002580370E|nr:hypothetical protein [Psychrobacter sp. UBA3068]